MRKIKAIIDEVAKTDITVLIRGESGTGRELLARAIHLNSDRKGKPFVKVDCRLIPARYLSKEFLDLKRSDLTGGYFQMLGNVNSPDSGTILLKDFDELNASVQAKLLQILRDDTFSHFGISPEGDNGAGAPRVVATIRDQSEKSVGQGHLFNEVFSKTHFVNISVPPLRERKEQIPSLSQYYFNFYKEEYGKDVSTVSSKIIDIFGKYDWPGNIRELENMVKRIISNGDGDVLQQSISRRKLPEEIGSLGFYKNSSSHSPKEKNSSTLRDAKKKAAEVAEVEMIRGILEEARWNRKRAAKLLGISYHALLYKVQKYHLIG